MKRTLQTLLSLTLCLLLFGAVMLPAAAEAHSTQVLTIDIQRTGEVTASGNDILLFTVVTTPAVKFVDFNNGKWEPYTTDFELVGTTDDGNLIWQQTRVNGQAHNFIEILWDDENGMRVVDFEDFEYPENIGNVQPVAQKGCPWCGNSHGDGFDEIVAWFHALFAKLFGARY